MVLLRRGLKERKHESYAGLRIFQVMSVAILSGLLWWHASISNIQDQVYIYIFFIIPAFCFQCHAKTVFN